MFELDRGIQTIRNFQKVKKGGGRLWEYYSPSNFNFSIQGITQKKERRKAYHPFSYAYSHFINAGTSNPQILSERT